MIAAVKDCIEASCLCADWADHADNAQCDGQDGPDPSHPACHLHCMHVALVHEDAHLPLCGEALYPGTVLPLCTTLLKLWLCCHLVRHCACGTFELSRRLFLWNTAVSQGCCKGIQSLGQGCKRTAAGRPMPAGNLLQTQALPLPCTSSSDLGGQEQCSHWKFVSADCAEAVDRRGWRAIGDAVP